MSFDLPAGLKLPVTVNHMDWHIYQVARICVSCSNLALKAFSLLTSPRQKTTVTHFEKRACCTQIQGWLPSLVIYMSPPPNSDGYDRQNRKPGSREMAQLINHFLYKHKDLNPFLGTHVKEVGQACNPAVRMETGGSLGLRTCLAELMHSNFI